MCQFKSALVLKDRIFLPDYDSHDKMLQELGIEDNFTNASKVFVRVELSPTDGNIFSAVDGWKLNIDQDILPEWWDEAERLPQQKELVETWMRKHTIYAGEHEVADGVWLATGSATVIIPERIATGGVIELNNDSVCINHKTHTIRSAIKWKQEE